MSLRAGALATVTLHPRRTLGNWQYVGILDPPGYAQNAYTVPPQLDRLMNDAGFRGTDDGKLIESRVVPLDQAQLTLGIDHIEVWRDSGPHLRVPIQDASAGLNCADCANRSPVPPFTGDALNVEIWPRGVDPFPGAVLPAELAYYPDDASHAGHGVLVESRGGAEFNGTFGGAQAPYYADPALDALLRGAARQLDGLPARSPRTAFAVGAPAVILGVLAIAWTSFDAERKRRRSAVLSESTTRRV